MFKFKLDDASRFELSLVSKKYLEDKLDKVYTNSYSVSNKFYNRMPISFELDYASTVYSACDIFFMLYNNYSNN